MHKGHELAFDCIQCLQPVRFSLFQLKELSCPSCGKKFAFNDEKLKSQLSKFEKLCEQLVESEEILADTAVGIDVGDRHIKIPYRLLLTRFSSSLELKIGNQDQTVEFRFEPLRDMPKMEGAKK